jgi:hypothetical protein
MLDVAKKNNLFSLKFLVESLNFKPKTLNYQSYAELRPALIMPKEQRMTNFSYPLFSGD